MAPVDGALVRAFHILRTFCINHFSSLHWTTTFISRDKGIQYQPVRSHFHHMITFFSIWHCYASRLSFVFKLKRFETAYCGRSFLIKSCTRSTDSHSGSVHRGYGAHICNLYADHDFTTATHSDKKAPCLFLLCQIMQDLNMLLMLEKKLIHNFGHVSSTTTSLSVWSRWYVLCQKTASASVYTPRKPLPSVSNTLLPLWGTMDAEIKSPLPKIRSY